MSVVLDDHGNPRPPYSGEPAPSVVTGRCWACGGSGWRDFGFHAGTNESFGARCVHCAGTGLIWSEVTPEAA